MVDTPAPVTLYSLMDEFLVVCPQCAHAAVVTGSLQVWAEGPRARCGSCGFNRRGWPPPDAGTELPVTRRKCGQCGRPLAGQRRRIRRATREVEYTCACRAKTAEPLPATRAMQVGVPEDPFFGYTLWLRTNVGDHVLWAYNRRHLAFLRAYVQAQVRPRTPHRNASLVSRLPRWMKLASNRERILKAIGGLESMVGAVGAERRKV